jgi:hypothetical protein
MEMQYKHQTHGKPHDNMMYKKLAIMIVLSFIAMYVLMYSMVDQFSNVIPNTNQFYMAGLMSMPMLLVELLVMGSMYKNKKLNIALIAGSAIVLLIFFFCIRQQSGIGDKQFVRSMIPHHAGAILMVDKASLNDPEIKELARNIIVSQEKEIEQMKAILKRLK